MSIKSIIGATCACLAVVPFNANSALVDRGGGFIYDDVLDITWLQDANYARTSGYHEDGKMSWNNANIWVGQLEYGGFTEWRLPTMIDIGNDGCNNTYNGTDCGYNPDTTDNELASLYFDTLDNLAFYDVFGNAPQEGFGLSNSGSFLNMATGVYWFGVEYATDDAKAWAINFSYGSQDNYNKTIDYYAWAVHDGDIGAVPIPSAVWLFGSGLLVLIGLARRKVSA